MSFNGSGTFNINTAGQPVVGGTTITSTAFNLLTNDLANGLSTCITKDGQTTTTQRIPFALGIETTGAGVDVSNASTAPVNGVYQPASLTVGIAISSSEGARFTQAGLLVGATSNIANMDTTGGQIGANRGFFTTATNGIAWGPATYINGTDTTSINVLVNSGGVSLLTNATSWSATSDERLKTDLVPITDGLDKVNSLRAVTGRYKTDDESVSRSFLIAQDVQKVLPEAVKPDSHGILHLSQTDVIPLLVAALKDAHAAFEEVKGRLAVLEWKMI